MRRYQREYFLALFKNKRRRCGGRVTVKAPTLQGFGYFTAGNKSQFIKHYAHVILARADYEVQLGITVDPTVR